MERELTVRGSRAQSVSYMLEALVVFCLICRLGFPGNLSNVFGGEKVSQLFDYGSSFLQLILIILSSGDGVKELRLLELKRKYLPVYGMLLIMFTTSLLVSDHRAKQATIIVRFSMTALFGLWLSDRYDTEYLLKMILLAQAFITVANLMTYFIFKSAGYYYDEGYGYTFRGLYTQKNGLGSTFAYGIVFQLSLLRSRRQKRGRGSPAFWAVLAGQVFLLAVSQATTAIFCCLLPLMYQALYRRLKWKHRVQWGIVYIVISVGFLLLALTVLPLFAPMLEAIGKDATLSNRTPMWEKIIEFIMEKNTLTGYGLLQFFETPSALKELQNSFTRNSWFRSMAYGAHSNLLEMWLDVGLIGLAAYFVTLIYCFRDVKYLTDDEYLLATGMMIPLLISGLTDRIYTNANAKTMFFFLMIGIACNGRERKRRGDAPGGRPGDPEEGSRPEQRVPRFPGRPYLYEPQQGEQKHEVRNP